MKRKQKTTSMMIKKWQRICPFNKLSFFKRTKRCIHLWRPTVCCKLLNLLNTMNIAQYTEYNKQYSALQCTALKGLNYKDGDSVCIGNGPIFLVQIWIRKILHNWLA